MSVFQDHGPAPLRQFAEGLAKKAQEAGLGADALTAMGALLCAAAFFYFWFASYWIGTAAAAIFILADAVARELGPPAARSASRRRFERMVDLVHPPLWWWAWAHGLMRFGTPLEPVYETMLLAAIVIGYGALLATGAAFQRRFTFAMLDWRPVDSRFAVAGADRDTCLAILFAALLFGRPDVGLELVALWTIVSAIFAMIRLAQAEMQAWRGILPKAWRNHG